MICPACKHDMLVVEYHDIELDYCNRCKGVWLDSAELELLLKSHGFGETKPFLDGILNSEEAVSTEKKRNCPICGHKMKKTAICEQPETVIDMCHDEHGLWFDGGEIRQLMRHLSREHQPEHDAGEQVLAFLEEVFEAPGQSGDGNTRTQE